MLYMTRMLHRQHTHFLSLGILLFAAVSFASPSQTTIRTIRMGGNHALTWRQLSESLSSRPASVFSHAAMESDIQTIAGQFHRAGYIDADVRVDSLVFSDDSAFVDIHMAVDEGRRVVVGSVSINALRSIDSAEVVSRFETKAGMPLDEQLLERDIDELLTQLEKAGYPLATCEIAGIVRKEGLETDSVGITLAVHEGERITIEEVQVQGNRETDPAVVVRETRLKSGEPFNPVKVDAIRQRVQRLNIFADVSDPQLYTRNNKGGLLIKVREGNTNTFDGIIGYVPASSPDVSGYVTGLASISMRNLFGTGRKLAINWQREDRYSQELGVRYMEPWVFSMPVNLGGGFVQRQQDTSYVRRVLDVKSELMISDAISASLLFGSESVIPSADSIGTRVYRSTTTSFGAELQYDSRDDLYSPTSGARYSTSYSFGRKRILNVPSALSTSVPGRVIVQRFTLDLDVFLSTFPRQVLAFGLHGRELQSGQIEEGDMFRLGGARTLRGYRESQFIGSRVAWSNTEYRFLLARRSFIYGFVDDGYYLRPADVLRSIDRTDAFRLGYGIGVQLETALGNLGVSFALGKGDTFSTAKIHFGLINEF